MFLLDNNDLWSAKQTEKCAVVLLGGDAPKSDKLLQYIKTAPFVAAADGGAAIALKLGRCPNLLIGDFDSLPADGVDACRTHGAELLQLPVMKDMTDGEYLLATLAERGYKKLLVLGALGGRTDMELANVFCAADLARQGIFCLLAHDTTLLLPLWSGQQPVQLCLKGFAGKTFSQVALSEQCRRIQLSGFLYPLNKELYRGQTLGLSNIVTDDTAKLVLTDGSLLTIINRQE